MTRHHFEAILLRQRFSPTDDLYVLSPLEHDIANGRVTIKIHDYPRSPLERRFSLRKLLDGANVIVSRYCTTPWLRALTRHRKRIRKIIYLLDDDLPAAVRTPELPTLYRLRLAYAAYRHHPYLVELADRIAVCSAHLESRVPPQKADVLTPPLLWPLPALTHFDNESTPFRVGFHGTLGHQNDLAAIAPAIVKVHDARPDTHFEFVTSGIVPPTLRTLERVTVIREKSWPEYKQFIGTRRYHLLLVPLMDTPFNRGKSPLKVLDAAVLGAVGIFSRRPPYAAAIADGKSGLLALDTPDAWEECMLRLIDHRTMAKEISQSGQTNAQALGRINPLRDYWVSQLSP